MGSLLPLRPLQQRAIDGLRDALRRGRRRPIIQGPTGFGKCLGRGTPVIMFDGSVVPVEDVVVGDLLMGPDSTPRMVLSTCRGREALYRVTPIKGESYVVNESHILSLKICSGASKHKNAGRDGGLFPGKVVNIGVREYLQKSKTFRHVAKGWRPNGVDFPPPGGELKIEPYFLGLWLGDGFSYHPAICTGDAEITDAVAEYANANGLRVRCEWNSENSVNLHLCAASQDGSRSTRPDNSLRIALSFYGLFNNKHVPLSYKTASRSDRLKLLAGMIDSDGHLVAAGGFEVSFKNERLMDDFLFVARSLGFSGYKKAVRKTCVNNGVSGVYFRCTLYGNLETIPTRVLRKRSAPRRQKKNHLIVGIQSVVPIGDGEYFGFEIGGDRLFLLGDFTVTHNTVVAAHIVTGAMGKGKRVAFCVPSISLIDQTFDRFVANGIEARDLGVVQANHPWRRPGAPIQICSLQTLATRGFPEVDFVVFDEVHLRYEIVDKWMRSHPEKIFIGLSATPWSKGLGDFFDDLIVPTSIAELTEQKWLTPIRAFAPSKPDLSDVKIVAGDYHNGQLSEKMSGVAIVGDVVATWLSKAEDQPTMVFAVDRAHADKLHGEFERMGVASAYVDALTPREERNAILAGLNNGRIKVICSVSTMTTGIDADIRCICWCRPTKSEILWVQSIGRGLRPAPGKENLLLLDHGGTALTLGFPAEIAHTTLRTSSGERAEREKKKPKDKAQLPIECPRCAELIPVAAKECPDCGFVPKRFSSVRVEDGELIEIGGSKSATGGKLSKLSFYAQLKGYAEERSFKPGWATAKFKAKTGEWPHHSIKDCPPVICGNQVRSWIRSDMIRWAKTKERISEQWGRL